MGDFSLISDLGGVATDGLNVGSSRGTTIPSAAANTKPSGWTELVASTSEDANGLLISMDQLTSAAAGAGFMMDLAIGAASSETIIIDNLHGTTGVANETLYHFPVPIKIPKGTRLSMKSQTSLASKSIAVSIQLLRSNFSSIAGGGSVTTIGADTSTTKGVVVDAGASSNTKGSWVEIIASTVEDYKGFFLGVGTNNNSAVATAGRFLMDIGVGGSGSEEVIYPDLALMTETRDVVNYPNYYRGISIPSGSRIAVRMQANTTDATDRLLDVVFYGVK